MLATQPVWPQANKILVRREEVVGYTMKRQRGLGVFSSLTLRAGMWFSFRHPPYQRSLLARLLVLGGQREVVGAEG